MKIFLIDFFPNFESDHCLNRLPNILRNTDQSAQTWLNPSYVYWSHIHIPCGSVPLCIGRVLRTYLNRCILMNVQNEMRSRLFIAETDGWNSALQDSCVHTKRYLWITFEVARYGLPYTCDFSQAFCFPQSSPSLT